MRLKTLIAVCYGCGLRINELLRIKVQDIDGQRKTILIEQGKGDKSRYVVVSDSVLNQLRSYWKMYHPTGWMFYSRLLMDKPMSATEETVSFKYRDYADNNRDKVMTLSCDEFLRRYLQHVLPKGFMRIRHYGFLANACRKRQLALIRAHAPTLCKLVKPKTEKEPLIPQWPCQRCKVGILRFIGVINLDEATNKIARTS